MLGVWVCSKQKKLQPRWVAIKKMKFKLFQYGGQAEIRTQERSRVAGFQDRCIQPLCHLSANGMSLIIEEN